MPQQQHSHSTHSEASYHNMTVGRIPSVEGGIQPTIFDATGDILYASAADTPARLGIGSTGQLLQVSGGVPTWATVSSSPTFSGFSGYGTGSLSVANATYTMITMNSELFDTDGFHSTSSNTSRMTIPAGKAGKYLINAAIYYEGYNGWTNSTMRLFKNGAAITTKQLFANGTTGGAYTFAHTQVVDAAVGDYFEIGVYQNTGVSRLFYYDVSEGGIQLVYLGA